MVEPTSLGESYQFSYSVMQLLERNKTYVNMSPKAEPQLGKRGLFRKMGGTQNTKTQELSLLWVLNLSDGAHSLLDIAEKSGLSFDDIASAADNLQRCSLLRANDPTKADDRTFGS